MFISILSKIYRIWIRSLQLGIRSPPGNPWCGWRAGRGRRCQLWPVMVFWRFFGGDDWSASTNHFCSYRIDWVIFPAFDGHLLVGSFDVWNLQPSVNPHGTMHVWDMYDCTMFLFEPQIQMRTLTLDRNACFRKPYLRRPAKTYNEWLLFQRFSGLAECTDDFGEGLLCNDMDFVVHVFMCWIVLVFGNVCGTAMAPT